MIAVMANDVQWRELTDGLDAGELARITSLANQATAFDGYLLLDGWRPEELPGLDKPVLVNEVIGTLAQMNARPGVLRINGWDGFLSRPVWEVAGALDEEIKKVFGPLHRALIKVNDEPGLVAARTIAMIINEAYFALGEGVSSTTEIDTAMKLGTNYPLGPFEWAQKIGDVKIHALLLALSKTDNRYLPAPLLQKAAIS